MSTYKFIKLHIPENEDSPELRQLKTEYNSYAKRINMHWPDLTAEERKEIYEKIHSLEEQVKACS